MPAIAAALGLLLTSATTWLVLSLPGIIYRVLRILGLGFFSFTGVNFLVGELETFLYARMAEFPTAMLDILNLAGFDVGVRMILTAWTTYITIRVTMGAFSGYATKPGVFRA
jgi:hypothetical protein